MGISSHEIWLILRARDEATKIIRTASAGAMAEADKLKMAQGAALATIGTASMLSGVAIIELMNKAANASSAYKEQVAKTQTQLDGVTVKAGGAAVSFDYLKQMGIEAATAIPVKFSEVQDAMYDIFSSIQTTGEGAKEVLSGIGKAAIAGKVDMQTAGRGILEVMNAWHLDAGNVNNINDVMFQLVRKGVGTYDEFSSTLGRSIPSAIKAGASFQDLAGGMAFLTKNGLSTAMASTAMGRAFDLLANPKFEQNMKAIGLTTRDASGNFKPMVDVVEELKTKMEGMSESQKADFLEKITTGAGGTVQALRFMTHALNDEDKSLLQTATGGTQVVGLLGELTDQMYNSGGAAQEAYNVMANTPESKMQAFSNQFEIWKVLIGDAITPMKLAIVDAFTKMFDWFNKLDPSVRNNIVTIGVIAAIVLLLGGAIISVVGIIMLFSAASAVATVGLGMIFGIVTLVIGVIAALIVIGYLIVSNWGLISSTAQTVWNSILSFISPVINGFNIFSGITNGIWKNVLPALQNAFNNIMSSLIPFQNFFTTVVNSAMPAFNAAIAAAKPALNNFMTILGGIGGFLYMVGSMIMQVVIGAFVMLGNIIASTFGGIAAGFSIVINGLISIATGFINIFTGIFTLNFELIVTGVMQIFNGLLTGILGVVGSIVGGVFGFISGLVTGVINFFKYLFDVLVGHSIIPDMVMGIINWIGKLPGQVIDFVVSLVTGFINWIGKLHRQVIDFVVSLVTGFINWIGKLPGQVIDFVVSLVTGFIKWVQNLQDTAISIIKIMVMKIILMVVTWINDMDSKVKELPALLTAALGPLGTMIANVATGAWDLFKKAVSLGIELVLAIMSGSPQRMLKALGNIGSFLYSAGQNLIQGFINGIQNMAGRLVDAARGVIDGAINAAKNLLGIHSPSKVFLEIGMYTGKGLVNGLLGMKNQTIAATEALANSVSDNFNANLGLNNGNGLQSTGVVSSNDMAMSALGRGGVTVIVNTQEIDPVKHAADLGYEIGKRLGV